MNAAFMLLAEMIRTEIATHGPIPFRRFMELALYAPGLGYYASGKARVGRKGDFFTNVSVGPLYGQLMARQAAEMWRAMGQPPVFDILEQGAHEGTFATDFLTWLRHHEPAFAASIRYCIIEPFEPLRQRQQQRLSGHYVTWLPDIPESWEGVHFSNELPDSFPVHRVCWDGARWRESGVEWRNGAFTWCDLDTIDPALLAACQSLPGPFPPGYTTEINLDAAHWMEKLITLLQRGWAIIVDYGWPRLEYYRPERAHGTLSGYTAQQRVPDILAHPGEVDITAHVDFTSLMEAARRAGGKIAGLTDQQHWIVALATAHLTHNSTEQERRALRTLMHPELLGHVFKILVVCKAIHAPLTGLRYASPAG